MGNSAQYFVCESNIVETTFASDVGNNTMPLPNNPIAHKAFDTRCTTLVLASFDTKAYLQSLNSSNPEPQQNLHQWSDCHAVSCGQDDVWTNPVNVATRGSRGGGRGSGPHPRKITSSIGLYRNMQLDPNPLGKVGPPPPRNVGPPSSMEYLKIIVE